MHILASEERLTAWLKKHGWPDKAANCFEWAISPQSGKVPEENYQTWDGSFASIPKDRKVIFKAKGLKGYTHVHLDSTPGKSEERSASAAMMPPEIVREKAELERLAASLREREAYLRSWEEEIRNNDMELRKAHVLNVKTSRELDERQASTNARLKEYEEHLDRRKKSDEEYLRNLNEAYGEISDLKEKHQIFGHVVYTIDKIAGAMALRTIKNLGDEELKKLPPGFLDDLRKFIADKAERHLFASVPEAYLMVGESFQRLPNNSDKYDFCRIVMGWLIDQDLNMFNLIGKETVDAYKERRAQAQ